MSTILITGANRGIGLELARAYAKRGDRVLACCREPAKATALKALGGSVEVLALDVADAGSVAALAARLAGQPLDILINNAGIIGPPMEKQTAFEMDFDGWAEAFAVNSMAPVRVMQALLPNLRASSHGRVASITSQMGAISLQMPQAFAYCASKAALNKFMRLAAPALAAEGIHLCVIHPGWVQTDMGGASAAISPAESAAGIVANIDRLNAQNTGSFWKWNGETHEW
ncbi:MAG: SDR family oxidoreductase [Gammaproteobacteria bacterium]